MGAGGKKEFTLQFPTWKQPVGVDEMEVEHKVNEYSLHLFASVYFGPQHLHQFPHLKIGLNSFKCMINMEKIIPIKQLIKRDNKILNERINGYHTNL